MIRCAHAVNLTFILAMVLGWKSQQHNIPILEDGGDQEGGLRRVWPIFFQFSTMAIFLLWLYKIIAFVCVIEPPTRYHSAAMRMCH